MNTCADLVCICGKHKCLQKCFRDIIKPVVFKYEHPESETQEKYCKYIYEPPLTCFDSYAFRGEGTDIPNSKLQHPCCKKYLCCCSNPICSSEENCGHGHYVPKCATVKTPYCHPDRPNIEANIECSEPDDPECKKCCDVFSVWEKRTPVKEKPLEECQELPKWDICHEITKCCCRCCTCRGCSYCIDHNCHPCDFSYNRNNPCEVTKCGTKGTKSVCTCGTGRCETHPCGCYFVPNVNNDLRTIK